MQQNSRNRLVLAAGRSNTRLAAGVADELDISLARMEFETFAGGEVYCRFDESMRGADVFVIQTHHEPANDVMMEQLVMIDTLLRSSADRVTAVCPLFGYSRQDRKGRGREPITARLVADLFEIAGADRLVSFDLHADQIQGFFDGPFDHLTALPVFADWIDRTLGDDVLIVSPDAGGVKRATRLAGRLGTDVAILYKRRPVDVHNVSETGAVLGEVAGRTCVIVDDMIDTGATIVHGTEALKAAGSDDIYVLATHGVFSESAVDRLKNAPVEQVVVTDSVPVPVDKSFDKLTVVSIAPLLADAIWAIFEESSVAAVLSKPHASRAVPPEMA